MTLRPRSSALLFTALVLAPSAVFALDERAVVQDERNQVLTNSFNNCVRTRWIEGDDVCSPPAKEAAPAPAPARRVIAQEERTVYFDFNKAALRPEARQKLDTLANNLKSDKQVRQARIVGFADRIGSESYNEQLSKKRAGTVKEYLQSRGFINSTVAETRWLGETVPATQCPDGMARPELIQCLQKDRRVEVEIDYFPETTQPAKK